MPLGIVTWQAKLCLPPRILPLLWHAWRFLRSVGPTRRHVRQVLENVLIHLPTTAMDAGLVAEQQTVPLRVGIVYYRCYIYLNVRGGFRFCRSGYRGDRGALDLSVPRSPSIFINRAQGTEG